MTPIDVDTIFSTIWEGGVVSCNGGGDFLRIGSRFALTGDHASVLLGVLPPIVHVRKESEQTALRWSLKRMMRELRERQLADGLSGGLGWLFALADQQIGAANQRDAREIRRIAGHYRSWRSVPDLQLRPVDRL